LDPKVLLELKATKVIKVLLAIPEFKEIQVILVLLDQLD
jgi:hypothetical protein